MTALFGLALFLAAVLLFGAQPMMAKQLLPNLGGAPAVWNACVMYFQLALVGAYGYAHLSTAYLRVRGQVILHLTLLCSGLVLQPGTLRLGSGESFGHPAAAVAWALLLSIGPASFAVAATAPLLQKWFSRTREVGAKDPFFLYSASNAGSLIALLTYPFLVEPAFSLARQSGLWSAGYALLVLIAAGCGWFSLRALPMRRSSGNLASLREVVRPTLSRKLGWLVLSFVPSSLMLGLTTYTTTDVAAIPLFWVVPLAVYLATYVLAFARRKPLSVDAVNRVLPIMVVLSLATIAVGSWDLILVATIHLTTLLVAGYVCHGRLYESRPPADDLTGYYFWLALGGLLGGVFNTLIAPAIFERSMEYPLALVLAAALRRGVVSRIVGFRSIVVAVATPAVIAMLSLAMPASVTLGSTRLSGPGVSALPPLAAALSVGWQPQLFALALTGLAVADGLLPRQSSAVLYEERTFFGTLRVIQTDQTRYLRHGTTNHGAQRLDPQSRCEPTSYFTRGAPIGRLIESLESGAGLRRVGVAGLGIGALAVYARPGQSWTFFELNPLVEQIARDRSFFTYLSDCAPPVDVVIGDARLTLEREPDSSFDLLVLDAFSSDAVPVHLLTREALDLYRRKLTSRGVLAFQITNRHLNLAPVLGTLAREIGWWALLGLDTTITARERAEGKTPSRWVVMARTHTDIRDLATDPRWDSAPVSERPGWSDNYSNVLSALHQFQ